MSFSTSKAFRFESKFCGYIHKLLNIVFHHSIFIFRRDCNYTLLTRWRAYLLKNLRFLLTYLFMDSLIKYLANSMLLSVLFYLLNIWKHCVGQLSFCVDFVWYSFGELNLLFVEVHGPATGSYMLSASGIV